MQSSRVLCEFLRTCCILCFYGKSTKVFRFVSWMCVWVLFFLLVFFYKSHNLITYHFNGLGVICYCFGSLQLAHSYFCCCSHLFIIVVIICLTCKPFDTRRCFIYLFIFFLCICRVSVLLFICLCFVFCRILFCAFRSFHAFLWCYFTGNNNSIFHIFPLILFLSFFNFALLLLLCI